MRIRRILSLTVPESTNAIWEASSATAITADSQLASDRAALLRSLSRKNTHRNAHPGHAPQWKQFQLALYDVYVTHCMAPVGLSIVLPQPLTRVL